MRTMRRSFRYDICYCSLTSLA